MTIAALALLAGTSLGTAYAAEGPSPHGVAALNHVWVLMMENHGYGQVIGNPYMPFTNAEAVSASTAINYYGVAHPSLTNYLEAVGGSNFGILDDNSPTYTQAPNCVSTLTPGGATNESSSINNCAIAGTGTDSATPVIDTTNETSGPPGDVEIDGVHSFAAATNVSGKSIADQLMAVGLTWKTYQESLPLSGPWGVTTSDGYFTDIGSFDSTEAAMGETGGKLGKLYRTKHNPFMYFASVQAGYNPTTGQVPGIVSYEGPTGLWADLATGNVPTYSFIVPNQCHDQHGGTSSGFSYAFCAGDPNDNGTQIGLNPALMAVGDQEIQAVVTAIKASPAWKKGRNAIVITWDENDYSQSPVTNQVLTIVEKNYGTPNVVSRNFYTHFSLLKSIESGLGLPCLNHACDANVAVMADVFH